VPSIIPLDEFNATQSQLMDNWGVSLVNIVERPVDTLGIDVLLSGVDGFLNIELFPGFRLWYFFLISVGLLIFGLGLKFFFGG
jgi:hypothetical protein